MTRDERKGKERSRNFEKNLVKKRERFSKPQFAPISYKQKGLSSCGYIKRRRGGGRL